MRRSSSLELAGIARFLPFFRQMRYHGVQGIELIPADPFTAEDFGMAIVFPWP
jgi:hypothetical protein